METRRIGSSYVLDVLWLAGAALARWDVSIGELYNFGGALWVTSRDLEGKSQGLAFIGCTWQQGFFPG
jgi:hypothetical protein